MTPFYAGNRITITLDLQIFDLVANPPAWIADTAHGAVTVALLSDDESAIALAPIPATAVGTIPGRIQATWEAVDTGALTPGFYRVDAQTTLGPVTYARPRIRIAGKRPT